MKFFKMPKNIKVIAIIKNLFMGILLALISVMIISDITFAFFMEIRNMTGYCTPFIANTIDKISDINMTASKMWAEDC